MKQRSLNLSKHYKFVLHFFRCLLAVFPRVLLAVALRAVLILMNMRKE